MLKKKSSSVNNVVFDKNNPYKCRIFDVGFDMILTVNHYVFLCCRLASSTLDISETAKKSTQTVLKY